MAPHTCPSMTGSTLCQKVSRSQFFSCLVSVNGGSRFVGCTVTYRSPFFAAPSIDGSSAGVRCVCVCVRGGGGSKWVVRERFVTTQHKRERRTTMQNQQNRTVQHKHTHKKRKKKTSDEKTSAQHKSQEHGTRKKHNDTKKNIRQHKRAQQ